MNRYTRQSLLLGAFSAIVSIVVLIGWIADIDSVKSVVRGLATMKFNTALCFLLSAISLISIAVGWPRIVAHGFAVASLFIAVVTLGQTWIGFNIGIDQWAVRDLATAAEDFPGRMSTATAFCFSLLGIGLILLPSDKKGSVQLGQVFCLGAFWGGMIGVNGYLLEFYSLYNFFWFSSMAMHTSLLFVVLGLGGLLARPDEGLSSVITSKRMGGRYARRQLPVALIFPLVLGWLLIRGEHAGYYDASIAVDLFVVATILAFAAIIWIQAGALNRAHQEMVDRNQRLSDALRENALYRAVVESTDAAVVSENLSGTIMSWNPAAERIYGYMADEMIGHTMARLIPHDEYSDEADVLKSIRQGEQMGHFIAKRLCKDGTLREVSVVVSTITDEHGKPLGLSRIARDITAQRETELSLLASQREIHDLKTALDEHAIVAITDPRGRITYANDKFCAISKYSRQELIGQDHRILNSGYHPKEFMRDLWGTISKGVIWHGKVRNRAKDGTIYWVDTTIVPFMGEDGKPRQYVAVRSDITDNIKAAEELARQATRLSRSNKDLEQFAYIASHDLQEPLRAVAGCAQLLKKRYEGKLDERADEFITHTVDGAERMQRLIRDLLSFSRVSTRGEEMQPINLQVPLDNALRNLEVLCQDSGAQITHDPMPDVKGDA
ncbi:MAG: sensor histidine kinase, partial [Puniceicoccales bacterium]